MKLLATETEICVIDRATLIAPTEVSLPCSLFHPKTNMEVPWSISDVFPGGTKRHPPWKRNNFMGLLTDFKKEMQQTELHACHLVHVKVSVNSFLLKHNTAQLNQNGNSADVTKQEKDLTTRLTISSLRPVSFK